MAFGGGRKGGRAGKCLEWDKPAVVRAAFLETDSTELAAAFLRISSSPHSDLRQIAVRLAAGVGPRLLQASFRDRIIQRLTALAQDSDKENRAAAARAAQSVGVADRVPVAPASAYAPDANPPETQDPDVDQDLAELLAEIKGGF